MPTPWPNTQGTVQSDEDYYGAVMPDMREASALARGVSPFTLGWLTGAPGRAQSDEEYASDALPGLRQARQDTRQTPWWQQAINAMGAVAPHLQDIPAPPEVRAQHASPGSYGFRGTGQRWQAPQPRPLARWSETESGIYPRFYRPGAYADGGRAAEQQDDGYNSESLYRGPGGGQDDQMPALVSPGEYIFSAQDVAMLGDGNNEEGARRLDKMRGALRRHLTSKRDGHPPMARDPASYLDEGE
jgi:hypothetical protein